MPWGLKRFQEARCLHFITFSCYQRAPLLASPEVPRVFEQTLERVRQWYGMYVAGYVVMPEHVHLLISEPEGDKLSVVIQMLKQNVAQQLKDRPRPVCPKNGEARTGHPFWYARYYDFNVWSDGKRIEKLRYLHRNPVKRGLVESPEDWEWSSFRCFGGGRSGRDRVAVDGAKTGTDGHDRSDRSSRSKSPPGLSKERRDEDGAPSETVTALDCILPSEDGHRRQAPQDVSRPLQLRDDFRCLGKLRSPGNRVEPLSEMSQLRETARPEKPPAGSRVSARRFLEGG